MDVRSGSVVEMPRAARYPEEEAGYGRSERDGGDMGVVEGQDGEAKAAHEEDGRCCESVNLVDCDGMGWALEPDRPESW